MSQTQALESMPAHSSSESVQDPPASVPAVPPVVEYSTSSTTVPDSVTDETAVSRDAHVQEPALPVSASVVTARESPGRPLLIPALYVDTLVAFPPEKEGWTKRKKNKDRYVGASYAYVPAIVFLRLSCRSGLSNCQRR
ncbi:hypothetical protein PI124_g19406 [Phytophthora idaei]|nr:hypothetical protein PI125_g23202 [Phytophthora idaei]KAG3128767.1 hypothetical protein PI126_g21250 [Phytophthora idaei]KAG3235565.1 hypothetical protein PI124_g19406 [Phytophthora idaei]